MITILIVDDLKTSQQYLKMSLEVEKDFEIVGIANNGKVAIELAEKLQPDIIMMDINMPVMDGLSATKIISERYPKTTVLIFSLYDDDESLSDAIEAGARGYLFKKTPPEDIVLAIRSAHQGYFQLGPGLLERYLYRFSNNSKLHKEIQNKFLETNNLTDKNNHLIFLVDRMMRNNRRLERSTMHNRSLIYVSLLCNCFLLIFIIFYQLF